MRHHKNRSLLVLAATMVQAACAQELVLQEYEDHADEAPVLVAEGDALLDQLDHIEDGWALSPVMNQGELFDRLAFRFDAATPIAIQARFSSDAGESWGEWSDVELTWNEDIAFNAHADSDVDLPTTAQLRFQAPVEAGLSFLAVEMFRKLDSSQEEMLAPESQVEQGLAADGVAVSRAAWGAIPRNCGSGHTPNKITVHHTVTPNNDAMPMPARVRQIQAFHINGRGWCDIGYHFLVGQDGQVYQGRYENKTGAHAANANYANVGVSYVGNFQDAVPSSQMLDAGARIIQALSQSYGIPLNRSRVLGHRQVGTTSTACPGQHLYARLDELLSRAGGAISAPPPPSSSNFCAPSKTGHWCVGNELVQCESGATVQRQTCASGCESMPSGTPDRCYAPPPSTPSPPPAGCGALGSGGVLTPGQAKHSCDGRFTFVHQTDGNVVLYQGSTPLWATGTHGSSTATLAMQGDGNLVLYSTSGSALWSSGTHGHAGASLAVQNDGNVVVYQGSTPLWATGTCCR